MGIFWGIKKILIYIILDPITDNATNGFDKSIENEEVTKTDANKIVAFCPSRDEK